MNSLSDLRKTLDDKFGPAPTPQIPPVVETIPCVSVCIPAQDMIPTTLMTDMIQLMYHSMQYFAGPHPLYVVRDTILQRSRSALVERALSYEKSTHVMFIDTDMRFPPDAIARLVERDKDIIGANYRHRTVNVDSTARGLDDKWVDSTGKTGVEEVLHTGTGMLLIKRRVFETMKKPWFETTYRHKQDDWMGEDVYFCTMARVQGFKVWVDHDLSQDVGHVGHFEFGWK